ncbi:MAG: hypothetical protein WAM14_14715 [Candidatus Nitrosopolaris sp.]
MTTEDNRNGNGNLITIELTEDLKEQEIVTNFIFDKRSKLLILSLNHKYKKKTVVSPVLQNDWLKTTQKFKDQMTAKGVTEDHAMIAQTQLKSLIRTQYKLRQMRQMRHIIGKGRGQMKIFQATRIPIIMKIFH